MKDFIWGHKRRFNSYPEYLKKLFGSRVQKLSLDAGFTCPNRDGTRGKDGCTFCNNNAFNPNYCNPEKSIMQQLSEGIKFHNRRYRRAEKYLAYFQAYSNTYAFFGKLKEKYKEALDHPEVIGLVISTRPDCVWEELLDYLGGLSGKYYIVVEYGIESCLNTTLGRVNRGHTFEDAVRAINMTAERNIRQGAHLIIGLPGETEQDIFEEMKIISRLPINNIKFHHLQILKETRMANDFHQHPENFRLFTLESYLELMVRVIENLNPRFVIERIAGEAHPDFLISPKWGLRYDIVLRNFEDKLEKLGTWQGKEWSGKE